MDSVRGVKLTNLHSLLAILIKQNYNFDNGAFAKASMKKPLYAVFKKIMRGIRMPNSCIPRDDADFDKFFKKIFQYVTAKTSGMVPEWEHIPKLQRCNLSDAYNAWYDAYSLMFRPHNRKDAQKKNRIRKTSEEVLKHFIDDYLHSKQVTNMDRGKMNIPSRNVTCTPYSYEHDDAHHVERKAYIATPWHNDWSDFGHHSETSSAPAPQQESTNST